jgi:hypothetical protein
MLESLGFDEHVSVSIVDRAAHQMMANQGSATYDLCQLVPKAVVVRLRRLHFLLPHRAQERFVLKAVVGLAELWCVMPTEAETPVYAYESDFAKTRIIV